MDKGKTILAIDDSETTLVLLEWFLKENGFNAITALSIKEAFRKIEVSQPDLILLDLQLPEVTGYDFLLMLKKDTGKKDIPVLVISALDSDESISKVKQLGAISFIAKPFKLDALLKSITGILNNDKSLGFYF
jgi:DNA-binding response OmpR family regulator